jgi:two-component system OmpR family sensor kinase
MTAEGGAPVDSHMFDWFRSTARRRLDAVPLSTKLLACMLVLLLVGTVGISLSIRQLVSKYLLDKTDTQLSQQAELVYNNVDLLRHKDTNQVAAGPTDYFLQIRDTHNAVVGDALVPTLKEGVVSVPTLPPDGSMGSVELNKPFTAPAVVRMGGPQTSRSTMVAAQAPWRVLALRWVAKVDDNTTNVGGVVYIGLSLSDQIDTVNRLTRYCMLVSIIIVLLGGVIASLLIQQTLNPLKRIEKTAAKIAAGDLSQRVPSAPENTEVGSLAASLNIMLARIERSFREQEETTEKMKRFVSDASHELRTPLATIHGYSELYAMQRDTPGALERADESIAHIEASSSRMTLLVEDLLSLARLDEGRGIDITQRVQLTILLADAADDLHALDPDRGITRGVVRLGSGPGESYLRFEQGDMPQVTLKGDGSRLRQVITNIVGNIHRYTPADSPVEVALGVLPASIELGRLSSMASDAASLRRFIEAAEVGQSLRNGMDYAVVRFIDHGPGVPESSQSQIFERFYTADPSRARQKGGTGLGMSIAQSVVKAHHGFICASTSQGGGLTLTVVLPTGANHVNPEQAAEREGAGAKTKGKPKPEKRSKRSKEPKATK